MWTHEATLQNTSCGLSHKMLLLCWGPRKKSSISASISGICMQLHVFCSKLSLNPPLDQSVCVVPVWPWQSFPCQWSSVAGSFRCAAAHLNIKRWSYDIVHRESGWTSQCPSLNGWLIGRYAVIKQERRTQAWIDRNHFQIFSDFFFHFCISHSLSRTFELILIHN